MYSEGYIDSIIWKPNNVNALWYGDDCPGGIEIILVDVSERTKNPATANHKNMLTTSTVLKAHYIQCMASALINSST